MQHRHVAALAATTILALGSVSRPAAQASFDRIVVFGTSLSDSGFAFALLGEASHPPDYLVDPLLIPRAPYSRGGHHFSNGATWVEQFARTIGLAGSVKPALQSSSRRAANYAVGAARAYDDGLNLNLPEQVATFLQDSDGGASPGSLYVIEMGSNDIRDALVAGVSGAGAVLTRAVTSIEQNIETLYAAGARRFLVWRPPNVGLTPALRTLDLLQPGTAHQAHLVTIGFNALLDGAIGRLSVLPAIEIVRLDAYRLLNDITADPSAFGLTNVTAACIRPGTAPFVCRDADEYLFWDGIHPSRAAHAITAHAAAVALTH
jgi:phospholipase/lecithinase/hemolysin